MTVVNAEKSDSGSFKCVLLYPDGKVKTAQYYHVVVSRNLTVLKEVLVAVAVLTVAVLVGLCVWAFCLPGSRKMLPCFKVNPTKKMSALYYSRLKEEEIIK